MTNSERLQEEILETRANLIGLEAQAFCETTPQREDFDPVSFRRGLGIVSSIQEKHSGAKDGFDRESFRRSLGL